MMPVVRICAGRNWQPMGDLRSRVRRAEALFDRRRTGNDIAAAQREDAPCLGKRRVMTDHQSDASDRRVDDGPSVAGGGPAPPRPRQMGPATTPDGALPRDPAGARLDPIPE